MQYRLVPPAFTLERLRAVREAVPRDPNAVEDCCAHLVTNVGVESRVRAEEWLIFLRALGLVDTESGRYYRTERDIDRDELCRRFRSRIAGAATILNWLESEQAETGKSIELDDEFHTRLYHAVESDLPRAVRERKADGKGRDQKTGERGRNHPVGKGYVSRVARWGWMLCK